MHVPVFRKTIAFANFSSIAITVSAVMSFYKRRVNRITYRQRPISHRIELQLSSGEKATNSS